MVCIAGGWIGRRWSSWEQVDNRRVWMRKEKDGDKAGGYYRFGGRFLY